MNFTNFDWFTKERKQFIENVNPLRKHERFGYFLHYMTALLFGRALPHERRQPRRIARYTPSYLGARL